MLGWEVGAHETTQTMTQNRRGAPKHKPRSTAYGSRTRPRPAHCRECYAPILGAIYDALPIKFDPYPLTPWGELLACLSGCKTFLLANGMLWARNRYAIETSPTGLGGIILRTHTCGNLYPPPEGIKMIKTYDYDEPDF